MANDMVQPYTGPKTIDLMAIAALLVDLARGALVGLRREQPGMDGVVAELQAGVPVLGAKVGISLEVYASFEETHTLIGQIRALLPVVRKAAEVLAESEAYYEDQRETLLSLIVAAVRTSARQKDDSLRAAFEKTLAYKAQIAMKGVKTRRKNAKDEAEGGDGDESAPEVGAPDGGSAPAGGAPAATP